MNNDRLTLLKELSEVNGVSGYEQEVKLLLKKHLAGLAEVEEDRVRLLVSMMPE